MISVVIPLYNKENSIYTTLQSVINQTYTNFEVVVVDDGSTDSSCDIVNGFHDSRISLIRKENGGVSSARNVGIQNANGEYISFLDADDVWHPDYLLELTALIKDFPDVGIYGIQSKSICRKELKFEGSEVKGMAIRKRVDKPWSGEYMFWTGSSSSSKQNLIEAGLFDERMDYGEDLDMWYRLLLSKGGAISSKCLAYYIQDSENRAMHRIIPFEKHIPFYIEKYSEARRQNAEFRRYFDKECLYRLFPYTNIKRYRKDLHRVLKQIDFSLQKKSMRIRFLFPIGYKLYLKIIGRI